MPPKAPKDWRDTLEVGDVVQYPSGLLRVVRQVSYWNDRMQCVTFSIKACSWTRRCYAVLTRHDLRSAGAWKVGIKVNLKSSIDRKILEDIQKNTRHFYCHQVKNLP